MDTTIISDTTEQALADLTRQAEAAILRGCPWHLSAVLDEVLFIRRDHSVPESALPAHL